MTDVVPLPPPKRPESRQVAVEIAMPRRPDSSRRGKRRSPSRQQKDLVNPVHGSNDPAPAAGSVVSGPGQFRNYASDTRYMESDPLRHGLDVKQVQATPFAMGPKSNPSSQTSSFRTLDISKANEGRQNWTRIDTFLTPAGHAHDDEFGRSPQRRPTSRSRNEASAKSLAQDVFITDLSEKFAELRRQIQEDTQRLIEPMQQDLDSEISKTKEIVQTVRSDNLKAVEEIRRLRSMEQHKHMLQAYPTPIDKDVFEAEFKRVTGAIQALKQVVETVQEEVHSLKEHNDLLPPSRGLSFRQVSNRDHAGGAASGLDETLQSIRAVLSEMDFSDFLDEIKRSIPAEEFRAAFASMQEQMAEVLRNQGAVHEELRNRQVEVDFTPVLNAFASSPLHDKMLEIRASLEQTQGDMAKNTEHLTGLWSQLPPVDFEPVFNSIRENRVELDLSPVLQAIQEVNVKEDMQSQFGDILAEINHRQSNLDFSPLLEEIKATKLRMDVSGVIASINDSAEEVSKLVTDLKPSLSSLEQSNASVMERLQVIQQVQDQGIQGIGGLKEVTERLAQKISILLQTISEKEKEEVKVNFTPVLEAIENKKVHIDFSPILTSIKKNCDFSDISEDVARVLKTIQEMKVQVDFTPVLRAVREGKQETVFELLTAFRDQCTDTGEIQDALVNLREATQTNLQELKESLHKESKEALTSEVLRTCREREVRVDIEVKKALDQSNTIAERTVSQTQEELQLLKDSMIDSMMKELRHNETRNMAESEKLLKAVQAIEVRPQVKVDLTAVQKMVEELQIRLAHLNEVNDHLNHAVDEQVHGQDHLQEMMTEVLETSQRQCESLKTMLREKIESVLQGLQNENDDAKVKLSEQVTQTQSLAQAIQQRPTKTELEQHLTTLLQSMQDELRQLRSQQQELYMPPSEFKREISDAMEAAAAEKVDKSSMEAVLREQMQRHKKDLQSMLEATLQQQSKDQEVVSSLGMKKHQEEFLAHVQDHLQSSFAQVLGEIRSQSVDLTPILTSIQETQEMTQAVSTSLRAWRASSGPAPRATCPSGEPEASTTEATTEMGPQSWEWQDFLAKTLHDQFSQQSQQLDQILSERRLVDLQQIAAVLGQDRGDMQATLRSMQDQLRRSELQQNPSSPYNAIIQNEGSISAPERGSTEILAAIRDLERTLDMSQQLSAVLAAVQDKDVRPLLLALQEQKTDMNAQFDDMRETVRQVIERPGRTSPSGSPSRRAGKAITEKGENLDPEQFKLSKILDAIKEQKVSIDFNVAQVLNNIQQKQQETFDKLISTDELLDYLKQGIGRLTGQETLARIRAVASPAAPSPRAHQWPLPGSPWIPPGILGIDK